jgi:hypothetical protein
MQSRVQSEFLTPTPLGQIEAWRRMAPRGSMLCSSSACQLTLSPNFRNLSGCLPLHCATPGSRPPVPRAKKMTPFARWLPRHSSKEYLCAAKAPF